MIRRKKQRPGNVTENDVKRESQRYLKKNNVFHWKHWAGGRYGRSDIADLLGIYTVKVSDLYEAGIEEVGIFMGIELKRPGDVPTEDQYKWGDKVKEAGGIWFWADAVEVIIKKLGLSCNGVLRMIAIKKLFGKKV